MPIVKLTDRFSESEIDQEVVLMRLDTGEFFSLVGTGRIIWQLIDEQASRETLLPMLAARFDAPPATLAEDFDTFLRSLADAGFVAID